MRLTGRTVGYSVKEVVVEQAAGLSPLAAGSEG